MRDIGKMIRNQATARRHLRMAKNGMRDIFSMIPIMVLDVKRRDHYCSKDTLSKIYASVQVRPLIQMALSSKVTTRMTRSMACSRALTPMVML